MDGERGKGREREGGRKIDCVREREREGKRVTERVREREGE